MNVTLSVPNDFVKKLKQKKEETGLPINQQLMRAWSKIYEKGVKE